MTSSTTDTPLTAAQEAAFAQFARLRVGALFMEQGMGKTRLALHLIAHRAAKLDAVLWVAPCSVTATIEAEIARWGSDVPVRVLGYETLSQSGRTWLEVLQWVRRPRLLVVADESIFIKNLKSKRTTRMYELRKHADYALVLNGTPLTRDLWDIKRQMDFLSPKIIATDDRAYRQRYFRECRTVDEWGAERIWYESSTVNVAHLQSLIAPYVFEARLDLGIAEVDHRVVHAASETTREDYERTRDVFLQEWNDSQGSEIVLYQLFSHLSRIAATDPAKCASIAAAVAGQHCLVFCNYLEEQRLIAAALGEEHLLVNGESTPAERAALFERSHVEKVPMLLTYGVGSFGLNLQHIADAHFASPTFDYGRTTQAGSRIRRIGQAADTIAYTHHLSEHGIDRMILKNYQRKDWLAQLMRRSIDPNGEL